METKRFRNNFSDVIEQLGGLLIFLFIVGVQSIPDILSDTDGDSNDIVALIDNPKYAMIVIIVVITILAVLGLIIGFKVRRWYKTWIIIGNDTITVERNTLRSVKNTVGIKNISNVNINQNIFEMIIGTCNLKLDTNSLSTADSTDIKLILKKQQGEELRNYINRRVEEINTGTILEKEEEVNPYVKYDIEVTSKDIITNGFYSLSVGTILLFLGSLAGFIAGIVSDINDGKTIIASLGGAITLIILIIGSLYSMAKSFLKMYDFKARRGKNKLYIKYGLYNKVDFAIPIDKINAIVVHQTFIARIFRKYSAEIVNVGLNDDDKASAYFTFYCSRKQLKSYIDKLLPEFSEGINGNIKKQPDKVKIKYIVDYLINSVIVLIVAASIIYYVNPSKVFEMAIVAGSAFILFYMFIAKILSFITCGVFIGDELVGVREGTMGTRYSLIKYCNIQYITINQNILEEKLRIAKGGLHILASMLCDDYLIPYMDENEISSIYNNIIK